MNRRLSLDDRGDFVRLALADAKMPDVEEWADLRPYVDKRHNNYRITEAGAAVWKEYEAAERKAERDHSGGDAER